MTQPSHKHGPAIVFALLAALCVCVVLGLAACTNDEVISSSYKTLKISADTYDGAMRSVADLYSRGMIDNQARDRAIDIGNKYRVGHQAACIALEAYTKAVTAHDQAGTDDEKAKLDAAIGEITGALAELSNLLAPYLPHQTEWSIPKGEEHPATLFAIITAASL